MISDVSGEEREEKMFESSESIQKHPSPLKDVLLSLSVGQVFSTYMLEESAI